MNSFNVNVRILFDIPRNSHRWIVEELAEERHARKQIYSRYIKFVNSLYNTERQCLRFLFKYVSDDVRSQVGGNMRKILLDTGAPVIPGVTRPADLNNYRVYSVPECQEYKMPLLHSLIDIREDNWSIFFNEENRDNVEELQENDILMMIHEVCTT